MDELDPTQRLMLDALDEEYRRRHGAAVEFLKAEVGEGTEYVNAVARVVISPNGAWFECLDLPMEFSGVAGGPVEHRFIGDGEAQALLASLHDLTTAVTPENTRELGLLALYTRAGIADGRGVYAFQFRQRQEGKTGRPQSIGRYQPETLPLFFRCRLNTNLDTMSLPIRRGVLFCLLHAGEKHLLVVIPYEGERLHDLSDAPLHPIPQ